MSSVIILALVLLGYTDACFEGKCLCHKELRLIDCTAVGLHSTPHPKSTQDNYTSILLRDNYLQHLNFSSLFKVLPRVVLLDLHYYVTISWVFNHPSQSRSFLIVSIQPPRFQPILLQRFQLPAKQNKIRMIHPLLPLTQKEQPNLIRNKRKPK